MSRPLAFITSIGLCCFLCTPLAAANGEDGDGTRIDIADGGVAFNEATLDVLTPGNPIPAESATEPDPSRGSGAGAAATVAADLEPPCVARDGGVGCWRCGVFIG